MHVRSLSIENFLSIEKAHIDFDSSGLLLIEGYNYDVDRANGAGKTAILNAMSFSLYDSVPRKITASEILRRGARSGVVTATVECADGVYIVERYRPKGVKFYKVEGDEKIELNITQKEWEQKLRLNYNQFIVSMYCSQIGSTISPRFLLLNDTDKKQFLLQLLALDEFALCKKVADSRVQQLTATINQLFTKISTISSKIDAFSESLIDTDDATLKLEQLKQTQGQIEAKIKELSSILRPDVAKYEKLEADIENKLAAFSRLKGEASMIQRQVASLKTKLNQLSTVQVEVCPTCNQSISNADHASLHEKQVESLNNDIKAFNDELEAIKAKLVSEPKVLELKNKVFTKKQQELEAYNEAQKETTQAVGQLRTIQVHTDTLLSKLMRNDKIRDSIRTLSKAQAQIKDEIDKLNEEIEVQKTVSNIYSPTGAQAYVLDSAVALFNEQMSKYVSSLWDNMSYELQSYKETAKGDVSAKFSESIIMDGKPISLGSLSGGELRALSICADMALLGLLEQQFGIHTSPILFDEAFDGLDSAGKEFALELIKNLSEDRQIVVIDHASEMRSAFDKVLRVEKRNGISTIKHDS